ncbi:NAD(P)-binding domain-containing protein [Coxiella-like endosymbiont]|uniref:NAD(P)-binding domain-containing protein n=1 Tax=Coxiella-like endosymbiont TaxID=1592897 RepID=UPI00272B3A0E|nr:NAD(P)-binding domain-containing protein [Coxiella-like endosymbiont]
MPLKNGEYPQVVQIAVEESQFIGVAGFGEMGKRFALEMVEMVKKYKVLVYDTKLELMIELPSGITKLSSLSNLFAHSTIVVRCTSKDITESNVVQEVVQYSQTPKWLFSLSSGDKEFFLSILKLIQTFTKGCGVFIPKDIHADVAMINESDARIFSKNGGNPINFRGVKPMHSVSSQGILLTTQGLMGLSLLQVKALSNAGMTYAEEIIICPYG